MFLATRHGNGAECVSCIVYFKVFGPWQGPWHCFYYCLWKGGSPLFAFRSTLAHTKDSIHGGDHEPIHEQHSSSTSDSGNREEVTTSLSYGHGVSVWTRWEGDNARESRATVSWVWESLVTWLYSRKKCMLIRGGWRARTETRISRNCLRGEIFHSNLFSHAPDVVL